MNPIKTQCINGDLQVGDLVISTPDDDYSCLNGEKNTFEECPLDDAIMDPHCLICITGIEKALLDHLLRSGYNAACYCYGILNDTKSTIKTIQIDLVKNEMECLNRAASGLKIIRMINGVKMDIELTSQEVSDAFYIQEHENHLADIAIVLEEMESNEELSNKIVEAIKANKDLMAEMVSEYEDNLEDYAMEWNSAATAAINAKFKSKGENQDE